MSYAIFYPSGRIIRCNNNGYQHCMTGPAGIYAKNHLIHWCINGEIIPVKTQKEFEQYLSLKAFW